MSEEKMKKSLLELMQQSQMTYSEAKEKSKQEAGRPKVERYRIGEEGEYPIRILPLAPVLDENDNPLELKRKGYEYPLRQQFIKIKLSAKKGKKAKEINIPVVCTSDKEVGFSVDLIDTYVKIAKELYPDDEELIKKMGENSFHNESSLKWSYQHAIYVLDVDTEKGRAKGPQMWQCSHSVYKAIDDAKMRLWQKMVEKDPKASDPVAGFINSYDVSIIRKNNNGKTEYAVEIGRDFDDLKDEEIEKLLELPRIPELIYRFTRYHLEAELVFLQQYDEIHDLDVGKVPHFLDAVETVIPGNSTLLRPVLARVTSSLPMRLPLMIFGTNTILLMSESLMRSQTIIRTSVRNFASLLRIMTLMYVSVAPRTTSNCLKRLRRLMMRSRRSRSLLLRSMLTSRMTKLIRRL